MNEQELGRTWQEGHGTKWVGECCSVAYDLLGVRSVSNNYEEKY